MRAKLKEDPGGDWAKLAKMATEEQALAKRVDQMMTEWAKLSEETVMTAWRFRRGWPSRSPRRRWRCRRSAVESARTRKDSGESSEGGAAALFAVREVERRLAPDVDRTKRAIFHVEQKVGDVPPVGRDAVRVVDPTRERRHPRRQSLRGGPCASRGLRRRVLRVREMSREESRRSCRRSPREERPDLGHRAQRRALRERPLPAGDPGAAAPAARRSPTRVALRSSSTARAGAARATRPRRTSSSTAFRTSRRTSKRTRKRPRK